MKNFTKKEILNSFKIIFLGFILSVGVSMVYGEWIDPVSSPHGCVAGSADCETPINIGPGIGGNPQEKVGGLVLGSAVPSTNTSLNIWNGKVGVGIPATTPPSSIEDFDVQGELRAQGLCIGDDCRTSWPVASDTGGSTGLVLAFDGDDCPPGWSQFSPASGRAVLGAGDSGTFGSANHIVGSVGGSASIIQSANQVASHGHGIQSQIFAKSLNNDNNIKNCQGISGCDNGLNYALNASFAYPSVGNNAGGQPMYIMNPYTVLTYCKKD